MVRRWAFAAAIVEIEVEASATAGEDVCWIDLLLPLVVLLRFLLAVAMVLVVWG